MLGAALTLDPLNLPYSSRIDARIGLRLIVAVLR
jgi:hypothetical protein